jgi:nicotinate-nucleotide adenylyltransferase
MGERRIALFGGTFDPVHNGHIEIARAMVKNFALDQLLFVPAHKPPHKDSHGIADAYHRYAMAVLATLEEPRVIVSTIELEAPDMPYTFETIDRLRSMVGPEAKLFFVMGADSFQEINTWREPARLLSSTNVIVVTRPGRVIALSHLEDSFRRTIVDLRESNSELAVSNEVSDHRIYLTDYVNTGVSSTEVRQRVCSGDSIEGLVPSRVADYISKYKLYRCNE